MMFRAVDKLRCAERELKIRQQVYPNRVSTGRMTIEQSLREIALMREIAADYEILAAQERLL